MLSKALVSVIGVYQKTLSPDHGLIRAIIGQGVCRYHPSCSEYTKEAVVKFGAVKGLRLGINRLSRCHPWAVGGVDLVPEK